MTRNQLFASILSASVSVTMLAGCPAPNQSKTVTPGTVNAGSGTNAGANANAGGMQANNPSTGSNTAAGGNTSGNTAASQPNTSTGTVAASDPNSSTQQAPAQAADAAAAEGDVEGYNAVAGQDEQPNAYYLDAVSASAAATGAAAASASPSAKPTLAQKLKAARAAVKKLKLEQAKITKLRKRIAAQRRRAANHLRQNEINAVKRALHNAKWTDNGDGTETKHVTVDVTRTDGKGNTWHRHMDITRTVETDSMDLVEGMTTIHEDFAPGGAHDLSWHKTRQDDGSYDVEFHQTRRYGKPGTGPTRQADWVKTIDVDGNVTGSGTITWTNKNGVVTYTEHITINGTVSDTDTKQTITSDDKSGTPEAAPPQSGESTTPDAAAGTSTDDTATGAASPAPAASTSPAASSSPAASASPAASTSPAASASASAAATAAASPAAS